MRVHGPAFHFVGLPHTQTTKAYDWCAYTAKVRRLADALSRSGHMVFVYGGEHNEARCTEHITVMTDDQQRFHFGSDPDWTIGTSRDGGTWWEPSASWWLEMNVRVVAEMAGRIREGDIIMAIAGRCQQLLASAFPKNPCVEFGVGYEGVFANYRVWESHAWRHHVLGVRGERNGSPGDTVIANSYDADDLIAHTEPDDYFLYMGRVCQRKGVAEAVEATRQLGARLVLAGPCVREVAPGRIVADELTLEGDHLEYVGTVTGHTKAKLLSRARALFCATRYVEPFGGVAVEAMMSGTPVLASPWGAFTETVQEGVNGFLCNDVAELVAGAVAVENLDREAIASSARARYSTEAAVGHYERYLRRVGLLGTLDTDQEGTGGNENPDEAGGPGAADELSGDEVHEPRSDGDGGPPHPVPEPLGLGPDLHAERGG